MGLLQLAAAGKTFFKLSIVFFDNLATCKLALEIASIAKTPKPPALVIIAKLSAFFIGLLLNICKYSNISSILLALITPPCLNKAL